MFNLATTRGFDIESIIFSFGVGGVASVLYEAALNVGHREMAKEEIKERRWIHLASLMSAPIVFVFLYAFSGWNPVYSLSTAMFIGGIAAVICRFDLWKNALLGGVMFTGLYFFFFSFVSAMYPNFVSSWNLEALSGVVVLGVPLEEIFYAFSFGLMWSGVFEHIKHYVLH